MQLLSQQVLIPPSAHAEGDSALVAAYAFLGNSAPSILAAAHVLPQPAASAYGSRVATRGQGLAGRDFAVCVLGKMRRS